MEMQTETSTTAAVEQHSMDSEEIAHLAGAFDVAGLLTAHITKEDDYRLGYNLEPICRVSFPVDKEDPLMGKLVAYCDENNIGYSIHESSHRKDKDTKSYQVEMKRPSDIRDFLLPMLDFLVTKYEAALIMLEHVLPRIEDGKHREKEGFIEIMDFVDTIRENSNHTSRMKYNADYFRNEWSISQ